MEQDEYAACLARAGQARTIAELHAIADEVRTAHRNDADAARVADVCQMYALDLLASLRDARARRSGEARVPVDYTERAYR